MIIEVKRVLADVLQIGDRVETLDQSSPLLGSIPEFDSMAVVSVITHFEERYGIFIDDDELTASVFETLGSLSDFMENKLSES